MLLYAQGLVLVVLLLQIVGDLAQDARLIPVPGFAWYLLIFIPVIYAGTAFGLTGSLAIALEATAAALPNELFTSHTSLAHWAGLSTLVMVDVCALLLGTASSAAGSRRRERCPRSVRASRPTSTAIRSRGGACSA